MPNDKSTSSHERACGRRVATSLRRHVERNGRFLLELIGLSEDILLTPDILCKSYRPSMTWPKSHLFVGAVFVCVQHDADHEQLVVSTVAGVDEVDFSIVQRSSDLCHVE